MRTVIFDAEPGAASISNVPSRRAAPRGVMLVVYVALSKDCHVSCFDSTPTSHALTASSATRAAKPSAATILQLDRGRDAASVPRVVPTQRIFLSFVPRPRNRPVTSTRAPRA